jgi:hypothetical protein
MWRARIEALQGSSSFRSFIQKLTDLEIQDAFLLALNEIKRLRDMARSHYIYLIRAKDSNTLLGGFTVKHEAHTWADRESKQPRSNLQLYRMQDGLNKTKTEEATPWDTTDEN